MRRLRGSWAVAIHDPVRRRLIVARDPIGGRRWVVHLSARRVLIGAEEQELLGWRDTDGRAVVDDTLDPARVAAYFALRPAPRGATFFRSIESLPPGEVLVIEAESSRRFRLPIDSVAGRADAESEADEFRRRLERAIAVRLDSARRPGVMLSGGLDSSPLLALTAQLMETSLDFDADAEGKPDAFSWTFEHSPEADERAYIRPLLARYPSRWWPIPVEDAVPFAAPLDGRPWPIHPSTPEQNPHRGFLERAYAAAAAQGVDVLLSGVAGDHLYTGTRHFLWDTLRRGAARRVLAEVRWHLRLGARWRVLARAALPAKPARFRRPVAPPWLTPQALAVLEPAPAPEAAAAAAKRPEQAFEVLNQDLGDGFARERFYAARHGLEVRYPFRDRALVEQMLGVEADQLYDRGTTRPILRRAVADRLPPETLARETKATFEPWLRDRLARSKPLRTLLQGPNPGWADWVRFDSVDSMRRSLETQPAKPSGAEIFLLWNCAAFDTWQNARAKRQG